jgi:hypothetical protein
MSQEPHVVIEDHLWTAAFGDPIIAPAVGIARQVIANRDAFAAGIPMLARVRPQRAKGPS